MKNPAVDLYLEEGCGRCEHYQTPLCKVHSWTDILVELRRIVLDCGLDESYKWSQPCYTYQNKNILIVTAFKDYACISFFKGSLLKDLDGKLIAPGKNSQAARQLRYTNVQDLIRDEKSIRQYVFQALEIEKAGLKVSFKKAPEPIPSELWAEFEKDEEFKEAFYGLSPGRQRGYILHFSQPKKSETRINRIEKYRSQILRGEGIHDAYRMK